MPKITVMYWNIENFGDNQGGLRGDYVPLCNFIARAVTNAKADILYIMEMRRLAVQYPQPLIRLQQALELSQPGSTWLYDWIPGSLTGTAPYAYDFDVGFAAGGRWEGYAVFWKLNIAKFSMQAADPIIPSLIQGPTASPNPTPNNQSGSVRMKFVGPGGPHTTYGIALVSDLLVPKPPTGAGGGWTPYVLPAMSICPGLLTDSAGVVIPGTPAPAGTAAPIGLPAGTTIPVGTRVGPAGITLQDNTRGYNPIVVPGSYLLTDQLVLAANPSVVVPHKALSLVMTGRTPSAWGFTNYAPPPALPPWSRIRFARGNGPMGFKGVRNPATCTIKVNTPGPAANRLIPLTVYHAPLNSPGGLGMTRGAIGRSLYEAFDHPLPGGRHVATAMSVVGGDFNKRLDPHAAHYEIYTDPFTPAGTNGTDGGANCVIRVNAPAPLPPPPAFPPQPPGGPYPLTAADAPPNKSTVQLRHPVVPRRGNPQSAVLSTSTNDFRRWAVDNVFYRGFTAVQAPRHVLGDVYDLLLALFPLPGAVASFPPATLQAFAGLPVFPAAGPVAAGAIRQVLNANVLLSDLRRGDFVGAPLPVPPVPAGAANYIGPGAAPGVARVISPQRRAAEFIRQFVSDHLPVLFQMNL